MSSYGIYTELPHLRCHQIMPRCPVFLNNCKKGLNRFQKMFLWFIYLIYMYDNAFSSFSFLIYGMSKWYMICTGFEHGKQINPRDFPKY